MRETKFIDQKKAEWRELEHVLVDDSPDPDRLSELFIQATDDLSYARTFYPNRSVRVYLNGLAQALFLRVYQNKRLSFNGIRVFFQTELPDLMWHARRAFLWATIAFLLLFVVGWVSSTYNPGFDETILGKDYIEMTKENIAKGNPMGVYQGDDPVEMFFRIGINNVRVDFLTFILGIFAGIGSIMLLIYNAVMVGVFQHFFWAYGGFKDSLFSIWVHGAFEISAMILSTVAGMEMGKGLVFPGTYSRLQAFQMSARRGIKIFIGVLCITVIAAFNESFLTRFSHAPYGARGTLIFISFAFIFFYFVYYPYRRYKAGLVRDDAATDLTPDNNAPIAWESIKSTGEVLNDTFILLFRNASSIFMASAAFAVVYTLALYGFVGSNLKGIITFQNWVTGMFGVHADNILQVLDYVRLQKTTAFLFFIVANGIVFTGVNWLGNFWLQQAYQGKNAENNFTKFLLNNKMLTLTSVMIVAAMSAELLIPHFGFLGFFVLLPILQVMQFVQMSQKNNPIDAFIGTLRLFQRGFISISLLYLLTLGLSFIISLLTASPLLLLLVDFVQWNLVITKAEGYTIMRYILVLMTLFSFSLFTFLFKFAFGVLCASLNEQENASALFRQIANIGKHATLRGLARE